jgi:hypothetical protein
MAQILISKDRFTVLALPLAGIEVTSDFFFLLFLFFFFCRAGAYTLSHSTSPFL